MEIDPAKGHPGAERLVQKEIRIIVKGLERNCRSPADRDGKTDLYGVIYKPSDFDPGKQYPDWPGKLDWLLHTDGSIAENGVSANVIIENLAGNLRELPISGTGKFAMQPDDIHIHNLQLTSGGAVITAQGNLGEQSNLQWKAMI